MQCTCAVMIHQLRVHCVVRGHSPAGSSSDVRLGTGQSRIRVRVVLRFHECGGPIGGGGARFLPHQHSIRVQDRQPVPRLAPQQRHAPIYILR